MREIRIVDVVDAAGFGLVPPCADPSFDHRSCDHWESPNGSRAARPSWLQPPAAVAAAPAARPRANPFATDADDAAFGVAGVPADWVAPSAPPALQANPFAPDPDDDRLADNPFVPSAARTSNPFAPGGGRAAGGGGAGAGRGGVAAGVGGGPALDPSLPRKLALLSRGLRVFGSYARVLLADGRPAAYAQFGPLSAYPRAQRLRELYPQLPGSPLPAVITCIATTPDARDRGLGLRLVADVCDDLASRGFAAVEAYPEAGAAPDATSSASPPFWVRAGFLVVVEDPRYPVVRREL